MSNDLKKDTAADLRAALFGANAADTENQLGSADDDTDDGVSLARNQLLPDGVLMAHLMSGVVYSNEKHRVYQNVLAKRSALLGKFKEMGLYLEIDEAEGYAYLRSRRADEYDEEDVLPPRLLKQVQLPFITSFLIMQLRQKVLEFDRSAEPHYILSFEEIYQLMEVYFKPNGDEGVKRRTISGQLTRLTELGLIRKVSGGDGERYEIKRIIKALASAQNLEAFHQKLDSYLVMAAQKNGRKLEGSDDE